jgi:hypothetical protein
MVELNMKFVNRRFWIAIDVEKNFIGGIDRRISLPENGLVTGFHLQLEILPFSGASTH